MVPDRFDPLKDLGKTRSTDGQQQIFYLLKIFKINLSIFLPDDLSVGP